VRRPHTPIDEHKLLDSIGESFGGKRSDECTHRVSGNRR
jgi:hypothetical protein